MYFSVILEFKNCPLLVDSHPTFDFWISYCIFCWQRYHCCWHFPKNDPKTKIETFYKDLPPCCHQFFFFSEKEKGNGKGRGKKAAFWLFLVDKRWAPTWIAQGPSIFLICEQMKDNMRSPQKIWRWKQPERLIYVGGWVKIPSIHLRATVTKEMIARSLAFQFQLGDHPCLQISWRNIPTICSPFWAPCYDKWFYHSIKYDLFFSLVNLCLDSICNHLISFLSLPST